jgi:hypothetical protein
VLDVAIWIEPGTYWYFNYYTTNTVRSGSRCALRLRYVDLVVSIEVAVEVGCCCNVFSC